jgi:5-methylcytosine-specific restriction enzyme subunit McrC
LQNNKSILVYEYSWLEVGQCYGEKKDVLFTEIHYLLLAQYLTQNLTCQYFTVYLNKIRFCNYVGVIKVKNLTIEILPKTDRHSASDSQWQNVLLEMLTISLQVKAKTTTRADIHIRQHSVLETYLQLFLEETQRLIHQGLVKKYRKNISNQNTLKGKLLFNQHVTKNMVHAERFFVSHEVYDRNNIYNAILEETLYCINAINASDSINKMASKILLDFPECNKPKISAGLFEKLVYDRKTESYKNAIELARIILLNYHPDLKGGNNNILAIMFDMNLLWESFIYKMIAIAGNDDETKCSVFPQEVRGFWEHPHNWTLHLKPDIVVRKTEGPDTSVYILDTKWKYQKDTTTEEARQMYAYGNYWGASKRYLLYPDKVESESVRKLDGKYYDSDTKKVSETELCGLFFIDLLDAENNLNKNIGKAILKKLFEI